jgi:hypothetical protein
MKVRMFGSDGTTFDLLRGQDFGRKTFVGYFEQENNLGIEEQNHKNPITNI